ncbi:hypothetical protein EDD16DRAFT_206350 [Pisolithus croceorrhizus]|nr:hypothetical protein EDD16DRAFT_206350 [Pisolithus croceorrhizus]KAI6117453.1 hypothetical protein EV401DRAFT_1969410 [Pisolithus croceorrhizus]KAI6150160.1 hypothetical protein EDD17DRAFT_1160644 [Pisolithus thermaeus]
MGSNCVLVSSLEIFTYSSDRALPLSNILSCVNKSASAPVNAVRFAVICPTILRFLAFVGTGVISAVFPLVISATYVAYTITIVAIGWATTTSSMDHFTGDFLACQYQWL